MRTPRLGVIKAITCEQPGMDEKSETGGRGGRKKEGGEGEEDCQGESGAGGGGLQKTKG